MLAAALKKFGPTIKFWWPGSPKDADSSLSCTCVLDVCLLGFFGSNLEKRIHVTTNGKTCTVCALYILVGACVNV